jgi:hypothetical protein
VIAFAITPVLIFSSIFTPTLALKGYNKKSRFM